MQNHNQIDESNNMNFKIELTFMEVLLTLLKKINILSLFTDVFGVFQIINIPIENVLGGFVL